MSNHEVARDTPAFRGEVLCHGQASGPMALLREPLSFWGGYDSTAGMIVEQGHPCLGQSLGGKILVMPRAKGSSSSSSVLAEAIRNGTGPAGVILRERDLIIAIGVIVARELYGIEVPLVVVDDETFETLRAADRTIRMDASEGGREARIILE
jgi:uncharacterized protein